MYIHVYVFLVEKEKAKKEKDHEELNELQYNKRVDIILSELVKQFPVRAITDKVVEWLYIGV